MILSSPFSRQNKNHQTWTNGVGGGGHHLSSTPKHPPVANTNQFQNDTRAGAPYRTQTLNRLDMHKRKQQQRTTPGKLQRNLSSLGHYPNGQQQYDPYNTKQSIYAPASIASPNEFAGLHNNYNKRPLPDPVSKHRSTTTTTTDNNLVRPSLANGDIQHYAATNTYRVNGSNSGIPQRSHQQHYAASESGKSGRESALSSLIERFGGTLKRRPKLWSKTWSMSRASKKNNNNNKKPAGSITSNELSTTTTSTSTTTATPNINNNNNQPIYGNLPSQLDPAIYSTTTTTTTTGKKKVEAEEIYAEGLYAIDSNIQKRLIEYEINENIMNEGETRTLIEEESKQQADYQELVNLLINWINDELSSQRIIVKDLQDDLYDGQILGKLIEKLHQIKLDIVEVTQNESTQRYKLRTVLERINRILSLQARWAKIRWTVDGIHGKNMVEIIYLLVTMAIYYGAPIKLPPGVWCKVLVVQKYQGQLVKRSHEVQLTADQIIGSPSSATVADSSSLKSNATLTSQQQQKRDAFDVLFEVAPEKLILVRQSLVKFANRHLNKINMNCADQLDPDQFSDGLLLVFLISSLEDYFVPFGNLFTGSIPQRRPATTELQKLPDINNNSSANILQTALDQDSYINTQPLHKLHNVNVAIQLIEEAGLPIKEQVRAEDIVNGDLKSVLRVLYTLFGRYKHV